MPKYGPKAGKNVEKEMHELKHHGRYKSKKQAIAVGLSKTRREGGKAPEKGS
ncbi:hypothetical protein KW801_02535 [Candidatus Saccharibacteria bacterium]|nr:hypothetical protein [Candidatus Saccharibacteria bacterium]